MVSLLKPMTHVHVHVPSIPGSFPGAIAIHVLIIQLWVRGVFLFTLTIIYSYILHIYNYIYTHTYIYSEDIFLLIPYNNMN